MAEGYNIGEALALALARQYGQTDGAHHKAWVIDQMVRYLTGKDYDEFVARCKDEGGDWDIGIAP